MSLLKILSILLLLVIGGVVVVGQSPQSEANNAPANVAPSPTPQTPAPDQQSDRLPFMAESPVEQQEAPSTGGLMLRTLGALLLIVGLIVAAAWGMKRFGGARFGKSDDNAPPLTVLNSVSLGDKRSIAVVQFGERTLLIGSTANSITLLAEDTPEPAFSELPSVAQMLGEAESNSFGDELVAAEAGGRIERW